MEKKFQKGNAGCPHVLSLLACTLSAGALIGCASSNAPIASSPSHAPTTQRQGADLGAAVPNINQSTNAVHQAMDHAAMGHSKGMDRMATGAMAGRDHPKMQSESTSPGAQAHGNQTNKTRQDGHAVHGAHGPSAAGKPGNAANVSRTINVKASDTMRFEPSAVKVKPGETIRFVVTNVGKLPHELVVGTVQEQKEHEQMMQQMPGMKHEEANGVTVDPGQTKTLVWQFGSAQDIELACHVPGHYPAGMVSKVSVARESR